MSISECSESPQKPTDESSSIANTSNRDDSKLQAIIERSNVYVSEPIRDEILNKLVEFASKIDVRMEISDSIKFKAFLPGLDVDVVCIPQAITREVFFERYPQFLKEQNEFQRIESEIIDEDPKIPLLQLTIDGVTIRISAVDWHSMQDSGSSRICNDLVKVHLDTVLKDIIFFTKNLYKFDIVPDIKGHETVVSQAIQIVKLWAKGRGIYHHSCFGINSWTAEVAWAFYRRKPFVGATISNFFKAFRKKTFLCGRKKELKFQNPKFSFIDDNSKLKTRFALHEFQRASKIMSQILKGSATWDDLFSESKFFHEYNNYLMLLVQSPTPEAHRAWCSVIETHVVDLVDYLENEECIKFVHVNPNSFTRRKDFMAGNKNVLENDKSATFPFSTMWFVALEKKQHSKELATLIRVKKGIKAFVTKVFRDPKSEHLARDGMEIEVRGVSQNRLHSYLERGDLQYSAIDRSSPSALSASTINSPPVDGALVEEEPSNSNPSPDSGGDQCLWTLL